MSRLVLAGVLAIALVFGLSLYVLDRLTDDSGRPGSARSEAAARRAEAEAAPVPDGALPPLPGPAARPDLEALRTPQMGPKVIYAPGPPPPPAGSWEAVPISAKAKSLGKTGATLTRSIAGLRDELRTCFDAEVAAQSGGARPTEAGDLEVPDDTGQTSLLLLITTGNSEIRIEDAPMETRGSSSEETISCAQRVLRGKSFKAPGTRAGERHRVRYILAP